MLALLKMGSPTYRVVKIFLEDKIDVFNDKKSLLNSQKNESLSFRLMFVLCFFWGGG